MAILEASLITLVLHNTHIGRDTLGKTSHQRHVVTRREDIGPTLLKEVDSHCEVVVKKFAFDTKVAFVYLRPRRLVTIFKITQTARRAIATPVGRIVGSPAYLCEVAKA